MQLWVTDRMNNWWCRQRLVKSRKLIRYTGPLHLNKLGKGLICLSCCGGQLCFSTWLLSPQAIVSQRAAAAGKRVHKEHGRRQIQNCFCPLLPSCLCWVLTQIDSKAKTFSPATGSLVRLRQCYCSDAHGVCPHFSGSCCSLHISVFP